MGGPSEPTPERVTATGEPCWRARGLTRPAPDGTRVHEPHGSARKMRLRILPVALFGNSLTNSTVAGALYTAM